MIKLKGDGESMAQRVMNKALGGKNASTAPLVDARGGHGNLNEPSEVARNLGMPSAMRKQQHLQQQQQRGGGNKDWSASSNRINMGAPVYMQSKTNVDQDFEDRGHEEDDVRGSAIGDKLVAGNLSRKQQTAGGAGSASAAAAAGGDEDDDEFDEEDEEGSAVAQWRAARLAELQKTTARTNQFLGMGHGNYTEITQDDFLKEVTKSKYCVVHFYHPEFERCKLIDRHLEPLARKHLATKWMKLDATKAPFFVGKLQIKMLPTVVFFKDGIARDRLIGLDELGATDDFTTADLEKRIAKAGVIITADKEDQEEREALARRTANSIRQSKHNQDSSDDDDD